MAPPKRNRRGLVNGNPSRRDERENQRNDRAWLAVKAFNELKPTLTSFARAVTGKNTVKVMASKTTCTDGDTVYIVPPIGLGDRLEHDRAVCDQRDPESLMKLCPACASRELLMRRMFHEIAHIAFESFAPIYKFERQKVHDMVDEWHPKDACNHATALHAKVDAAENHNGLATAFHQFLFFILQAYDDARVDSKMYRARPGLKIPTEAGLRLIFTRGIETADGSRVHWKETPVNAQVTIGLMMVGMGLDLREGYLSDKALEYLADPELVRISDRAHMANTIGNSFDIALAAFRRLQEMDLCYVPKCVPIPSLDAEPDPNDKEDGDDSDSGENSGGSGSGNSEPEDKDDKAEAPEDPADPNDADDRDTDDTSDGTPGDSTESRDAGGGGHQQDADATPEPSGDGDDDFENDDSRGSGQDQEGGPGDDEPEDRDVRDGDDGPESSELPDDDEGDGDPADRHGDGDGGNPSEPSAGDDEGEPAGPTEGDSEDPSGEDDDAGAGSGDDGAGERDDDGSDRTPGADAEGPGAGGGDPGSGEGDAEAEAGADLEEADLGDGDGERPGDELEGDDDLVEAEDDADEAEAPAPLGESVWDDDNPEDEVVAPFPGMTDEEREALMGRPEDVGELMEQFLGHGHEEEIDAELLGEPVTEMNENEAKRILQAMATAVGQEAVFDTSSKTVRGVQVVKHPHPAFGWQTDTSPYGNKPADFMPAESVIGRNLMQARVVFSENKRSKTQGNLKSGKINSRVLGRRAALGDDRLFKKKKLPGKRDYFVVIGADCSGSTNSNRRNERIKRAVFAKAELLNRLGIPFAIYGHTGGEGDLNIGWWSDHPDDDEMTEAWMMEVKGPNEPWTDAIKQRLADMPPVAENLDGHSLEFYRKVAEKSTATDRIIIYYTDGAMPAANYDEELAILETEIATCRKKDITLMAVGINTDSPARFGFDTVCVQSDEDLSLVVDRLKARLTS